MNWAKELVKSPSIKRYKDLVHKSLEQIIEYQTDLANGFVSELQANKEAKIK